MRYEIVPFPIPTNDDQIEAVEGRLEKLAAAGGELVTFMPTRRSDVVFGVFRVSTPGALKSFRNQD